MRNIIYYVATSLDGFISGPNDDVSAFAYEGDGVKKYLQDLQDFDTTIMGRKTYESGYKFGLEPGQPAYPHMEHYIFSETLKFEAPHEKIHVEKPALAKIDELKNMSGTDIYLCGGGEFAGWLLENGRIDVLKIKLNPIILGGGVKLFGNSTTPAKMKLREIEQFEIGMQILTYDVVK